MLDCVLNEQINVHKVIKIIFEKIRFEKQLNVFF
jgi:hypothetical protein